MDASNAYHKTLKEHHVIIHFANKTEKRNIFSVPEGNGLTLSSHNWSAVFVREYVPLVDIETKDNLLSICCLEHITCSLWASERTIHRLPFLLLCYPNISDVAGIKFFKVWISAFRIWSHQL